MFGRRQRPKGSPAPAGQSPAAGTLPPPIPADTAAGAAAVGRVAGSGMVPHRNELEPYGGPGLVPSLPGQPLVSGDPSIPDLPPDSLYADRVMRGGVQTLSAFGEFLPRPPLMGGFVLMAHRPALAPMEGETMQPQSFESATSWREAPPILKLCRSVPTAPPAGGAS